MKDVSETTDKQTMLHTAAKDKLRVLHLTTLKTRCIRGDLIQAFKIMKGHVDVDYSGFFSLSGGVLRGYSMKLFRTRCHTNLHKNIFSNGVVDLWNDLNQDIINGINVDRVKNKLDNFFKCRGLI